MTIKYRGFVGNLEIDLDTKLLVGKVQNIRAALLYQGATVDEAVADFHAAIDDYLADCERRGIQPEQSYNGVFQVRISPETHFALATEAAELSTALNSVVSRVLERHVSDRAAASRWTGRLNSVLLAGADYSSEFRQAIELLASANVTSAISPSTSASSRTVPDEFANFANVRQIFSNQQRLLS